jgi:hypothetical protein
MWIRWGVARMLVRALSKYSEVLPDYLLGYLRASIRYEDTLGFLDALLNCLVVLNESGVKDPEVWALVASLFDPDSYYPWVIGGG